MVRGLGVDEALEGLDAGDACADEDGGDDEQPGASLSELGAQQERDAERDGRERVAEVVDDVREQGDAAGQHEDRGLGASSDGKTIMVSLTASGEALTNDVLDEVPA